MRNTKSLLLVLLAIVLPGILSAQVNRSPEFKSKYKLKEVVVLSRHNIRSPLSGNGSALGEMTSHEWHKWSSGPSELTQRGGALETIMGQYFRNWLVNEGLFTENYFPNDDEVNIYANSMQRTIATAQYFSSGFMPVANLRVYHRFAPSKMDPIFCPRLTKLSKSFCEQAMKQIEAMGGKKGIRGINEELKESYDLIADILDIKDSPSAQKGGISGFNDYNTQISLKRYNEPTMKGSLKDANSASDAFILQYYEEPDTLAAAFGHNGVTRDQWKKIAKVKDVYGDVLFTAPIVAANIAHPLLVYMKDELDADSRKFTFLCGHDSNIASVNAALGVEPYELQDAIENVTPIGCKVVIEKWAAGDGTEYCSINLVYQTVDQMRNISLLSLDNPPKVKELSLKGLTRNADGLYNMSDVKGRFVEAINAYDAIEDDSSMN